MKRIYYIGLTFAITGFYAVAPTAAEAADENPSPPSSLDPRRESALHHARERSLPLSSMPSAPEEQKAATGSDVSNPSEQSSISLEATPPSVPPVHQHIAGLNTDLGPLANAAYEMDAGNIHVSSAQASAPTPQPTPGLQFSDTAITSPTFNKSDSLLTLAPEPKSVSKSKAKTEVKTTHPEEVTEPNISSSSASTGTAQAVLDTQPSEPGTPYTFSNSDALLALAPELDAELNNETESITAESAVAIKNDISSLSPPTTSTPIAQSAPDFQSSTETPSAFDSRASLLPLNSESIDGSQIETEPTAEPGKAIAGNTPKQSLASTPIAQSAPQMQAAASEPSSAFDNGASLLRPLPPEPAAEPTSEASETLAIPSSSIADSATPSTATTTQSNLDTTPITPRSPEILDNYGLVSSVKGNKVSVRLLSGKNKTYKLASSAVGKNLRRGRLMGFNTDRRGRIVRLAPPQIKKVYQGTLIIVEGTKIGMVTPEGERFITTLSKAKISRMGLAPGQPIKITQYRGTWATKVCRPGILSNRQISSDAMQQQRSFLRGEASATL